MSSPVTRRSVGTHVYRKHCANEEITMPTSVIEGTSLLLAPDEFPDPIGDLSLASPGAPPATAVLAGGCFWCTEAVYRELSGVLAVTPGYAGDTRETADYETVCTGRTKHAEA